MSEVGDAINEARAEIATASSEFMADLCDLTTRTAVPDGYGGTTESSTAAGTNIPCTYEVIKSPLEQKIAGSSTSLLTHKITMPSNATTEAIRPHYKIVVQARDNTPALTFENPVILSESLAPFVVVAAALKV